MKNGIHNPLNRTEREALLADLCEILGHVRSRPEDLLAYGQDWTRLYPPRPLAVVLPETTEQVLKLVRYANQRRIPLVPSGGRTGLSAGAVAAAGEVVVCFERMNRILHFDPLDRTVTCEPGVVTQSLQDYARQQKLCYPVDFASRGSSQIGGNIATNAGGIKVIRYGMTRDWVMGLKVVTGRGDLLVLNRGLVKNASGYDLRHLFIGSEGTLGLIVEATLRLTRPPGDSCVMVLGVPALDGLMAVFDAFRNRLILRAFEFFSEQALQHVIDGGRQRPFDTQTPYYVLVELENAADEDMETTVLPLYAHCLDRGWLADGVMSQSETQAAALWRLREDISEALARYCPYKNDISVRVSQVPAFLADIDAILSREYPDFQVVWFGHIGDGNLHINVLKPPELDPDTFLSQCQRVNSILFRTLQRYGGSISAEHGVGLAKKPYLHYTRDPEEIDYLRAVKNVFDPNGILNPGKIFD